MVEARLQARYNPLLGFLPQLGLAAILLVGGREVVHHQLSIGQFTRLLHLPADAALADEHARRLARHRRSARRASGIRVFQVLDRSPELTSPAGRAAAPRRQRPRAPRGRDDALRATARRGRAARDVDLDVAAGRTVALVGATGSGKTTLAALVARLYDPTEGRVLIDGADLREVELGVAARRDRDHRR